MFKAVVACLSLVLLSAAGSAPAAQRPAVTPERFAGGQVLVLSGLLGSDTAETQLALINLASSGNRCSLSLTGVGGALVAPRIELSLKPRERRPFLNVFEGLAGSRGTIEARATVSCDRDFSAYAVVDDSASGRSDVIAPEARAAMAPMAPMTVMTAADRASSAPPKVVACSIDALCLDAPGVVHIPSPPPGLPVGRVSFPAPAGVAERLRLTLDVTVSDWYKPEPSGKHLIYWFVVNKNIDMPGLLYFRGPDKDQAFARHGMGLTHPQKIKMILPFKALPGHTYHVDNDYDMARHSYTVTVSDAATGEVKVVLHSRPNVDSYVIKAGSKFLVDMGFYPGKVETEVPSYGWRYANVHVEAYLR
jgi:hypothetical protein